MFRGDLICFKEKVRVYFHINEDILGLYFKHSMKAGNVELCRSRGKTRNT